MQYAIESQKTSAVLTRDNSNSTNVSKSAVTGSMAHQSQHMDDSHEMTIYYFW